MRGMPAPLILLPSPRQIGAGWRRGQGRRGLGGGREEGRLEGGGGNRERGKVLDQACTLVFLLPAVALPVGEAAAH